MTTNAIYPSKFVENIESLNFVSLSGGFLSYRRSTTCSRPTKKKKKFFLNTMYIVYSNIPIGNKEENFTNIV